MQQFMVDSSSTPGVTTIPGADGLYPYPYIEGNRQGGPVFTGGQVERQLYSAPTGPDGKPLRQLDPNNYVQNIFDPTLYHYRGHVTPRGGWMQSHDPGGALFNPNQGEQRTGVVDSSGVFDPTRFYGGREESLAGLKGLSDEGFSLGPDSNGKDVMVSPETVAFMKATVPMYEYSSVGGFVDKAVPDFLKPSGTKTEEQKVREKVAENLHPLYENQSWWQKANGFKQGNSVIQNDLNNIYQKGLALTRSDDPKKQARGKQMLDWVTRAQYTFNQSIPKVSANMQKQWNQKVQGVRNFANNNWWWMLPAGGLLLGGLATLANRGGQQAPQEQLPDQWRTGIGKNSGNVMYQGRQNPMFENAFATNAPGVRSNLNQNPMNTNFQNPGIAPVRQPTTPWNEQSQGVFA